ncbi:MFS transporter [Sulfurihydrogenibium sp.]|uniref:MFS transporter n=1 Tax=Sulfurihydrogenibium sp. TaxID=2053621 RepID=UPI00262E5661|nr:MFS transporter [Sulfurihydrogenibium sp.]
MKHSKKILIFINLITFLVTVSTEIYETLLPFVLVNYFAASMVVVGLIDGIGEAFSNIIKILGGYLSDVKDRKRVLFLAMWSLLFSNLYVVFSKRWSDIMVSAFAKSIGEGLFVPGKDKVLSGFYRKDIGKIFSANKIFENAGELTGIFLAFLMSLFILKEFGYKYIFLFLGFIVFVAIILLSFVLLKPDVKKERKRISWKILEPSILIFFFMFSFVNLGYSFYILKVYNFFKHESFTLALYLLFGLILLISTYFAGKIYDKVILKSYLYLTVFFFIVANLLLIVFPPVGLIFLAVGEAFLEIGI